MPAPLSMDLRQRIITAFQNGEASPKEIALRFAVSLRTVGRLIERYERTGSVAPTPQRHGALPRIQTSDVPLFEAWLAEDVSMTQAELARRFAQERNVTVSQQTVSHSLKRLKVTRKKSR